MDSTQTTTEIESLATEWKELARELGASPFATPGWMRAWSEAFGDGPPTIICARRRGRLVGVLPLRRRTGNLLSLTNWHTPEFAPLAVDRDALKALLDEALEQARGRLDLSFLNGNDATVQESRGAAERGGARCETRVVQRSPYLELNGDWEAYEASLPSRKRSKLRKARRLMEEQGELSVDVEDGSGDLERALQEGFEVEAAGWKGSAGTAIAAHQATRTFYESIARWAAQEGWLRLVFLRVDQQPVAFGFALESSHSHYDLKNGFDPAYARCSPGVLLAEERIKHSFGVGLDRYEFLGDAERHKLDWTSSCHERTRVQLFPRTARGRLERLAWIHGRPLRTRALAATGGLRDRVRVRETEG